TVASKASPATPASGSMKSPVKSAKKSSSWSGVRAAAGAAAGFARPVSALGTAESACCADETALCTFPAAVAPAWVTAAAWAASPPELVLDDGGVNGVSDVAAADAAA